MAIELIPIRQFSIEELTELYNQTRVDYLVPMPMSANIMAEYIHDFDVDIMHSYVGRAADDGQVLGLGMMGRRPGRSWVTRLGVVSSPARRRERRITEAMLRDSDNMGLHRHHKVIEQRSPHSSGDAALSKPANPRCCRAPRPLAKGPRQPNWLNSNGR
jgi:hypothetical protein